MVKLGYWRCGVNRLAVCHCHYLCEIGDWARDYGAGTGDDLDVESLARVDGGLAAANPAIHYYLPVYARRALWFEPFLLSR